MAATAFGGSREVTEFARRQHQHAGPSRSRNRRRQTKEPNDGTLEGARVWRYAVAMSSLSRIGVAIETDLLAEFDALVAERGSPSRSEAFRDLIRDALIQESAAKGDTRVVGTVTLVYAHHVRLLSEKLTSLQHAFHHVMLSTLHVHLDHEHCLEVIVVRGKASEVRHVANALISMKGVKHGRLTITSPNPPGEGGRGLR